MGVGSLGRAAPSWPIGCSPPEPGSVGVLCVRLARNLEIVLTNTRPAIVY